MNPNLRIACWCLMVLMAATIFILVLVAFAQFIWIGGGFSSVEEIYRRVLHFTATCTVGLVLIVLFFALGAATTD